MRKILTVIIPSVICLLILTVFVFPLSNHTLSVTRPVLAQTIFSPTTFIYLPLVTNPVPQPLPNTVTVLDNHSTWQQGGLERTSTYLYGEILNTTSDYVKPLGVTVNFYNDQGTKLETINSTTFSRWFNVLPPGEKSCFYIVRGFYHDSEVWASYDFEPVQYEVTSKRPPGMLVTGMYTATEYSGFTVHLELRVNDGSLEKESWWAKAALYDGGKIISCQEVGYTLDDVSAGGNVQIKVTYSDRTGQYPNQNIDPFDPAKFRLELPGGRGVEW